MEIQFDRAVVVVPLGVHAMHRDDRFVSTDTIANVLSTYRKHLELSPEEGAIVERLRRDLFDAMESDARTLLEHVSWAIGCGVAQLAGINISRLSKDHCGDDVFMFRDVLG